MKVDLEAQIVKHMPSELLSFLSPRFWSLARKDPQAALFTQWIVSEHQGQAGAILEA